MFSRRFPLLPAGSFASSVTSIDRWFRNHWLAQTTIIKPGKVSADQHKPVATYRSSSWNLHLTTSLFRMRRFQATATLFLHLTLPNYNSNISINPSISSFDWKLGNLPVMKKSWMIPLLPFDILANLVATTRDQGEERTTGFKFSATFE